VLVKEILGIIRESAKLEGEKKNKALLAGVACQASSVKVSDERKHGMPLVLGG
jgi:hypothetical protein